MAIDKNFPGASCRIVKGKEYWRFRKDGEQIALPGAPGDECFALAYAKLAAGQPLPSAEIIPLAPIGRPNSGTWGAAWTLYKQSAEWLEYAPLTSDAKRRRIETFLTAKVDEDYLLEWKDAPIAETPAKLLRLYFQGANARSNGMARQTLDVVKSLCETAIDAEWIEPEQNPTLAISIKQKRSKPSPAWPLSIRDKFEAFHPVGSAARTAYALAFYMGNRRSDVAAVRWDQLETHEWIDDDGELQSMEILHFHQRKNQKRSNGKEMHLPIAYKLKDALDALDRSEGGTILKSSWGRGYKETSLTNMMGQWIEAAGIPAGYTMHGLRRTFAHYLTDADMDAVSLMHAMGHSELATTQVYVNEAGKRKAQIGMKKAFDTLEAKRDEAKARAAANQRRAGFALVGK